MVKESVIPLSQSQITTSLSKFKTKLTNALNFVITFLVSIFNICLLLHTFVLQVDETLPKEKQKSQAKNLLQRKRKALSDLFRTLADLGLSYRAGLIVCGDELSSSTIKFATLPPLDISAALTQIESRY